MTSESKKSKSKLGSLELHQCFISLKDTLIECGYYNTEVTMLNKDDNQANNQNKE